MHEGQVQSIDVASAQKDGAVASKPTALASVASDCCHDFCRP